MLVLAASVWENTHCIYTHDSHVPTTSGKLSLYVYIQLSIRCSLFAYVGTYNNTGYKYCAFKFKVQVSCTPNVENVCGSAQSCRVVVK